MLIFSQSFQLSLINLSVLLQPAGLLRLTLNLLAQLISRRKDLYSHCVKWHQLTQTFAMVGYVREITVNKSCKFAEYGSFFFVVCFRCGIALTRSSLLWVLHTRMSGANPLQTSRACFWGIHKWVISAALLGCRVSRTAGNVLVFGPLLDRGIELRYLCQSPWDSYSVCSGLFWRWWSVGFVAADGVRPGLGCILWFWCERWLSFYYGWEF